MSAASGQNPRVLVLGAGAIGGFLGARLIEAGAWVSFLVRPARAERLRRDGLRILSEKQAFAAPIRVLTSAEDDHHGLIMLACKAYDLDAAIDALRPAMGHKRGCCRCSTGWRISTGWMPNSGPGASSADFAKCRSPCRMTG